MQVQVRRIHSLDLPLPEYMTPQASGIDLYAAVENQLVIPAGKIALIPTGLAMSIPGGYEGQIRPRSGLALKYGITLLNTPGTIDADYRGEIKVIVINLGDREYILKRGERIAQMVFSRIERVELIEHKTLDDTSRGQGGFGHTGI